MRRLDDDRNRGASSTSDGKSTVAQLEGITAKREVGQVTLLKVPGS